TQLAGKIKGELTGRTIGGTRVSYGRADHRFGFAILAPAADGWSADFHHLAGASLVRCQIAPGHEGARASAARAPLRSASPPPARGGAVGSAFSPDRGGGSLFRCKIAPGQ